jgi:hypothetical protein
MLRWLRFVAANEDKEARRDRQFAGPHPMHNGMTAKFSFVPSESIPDRTVSVLRYQSWRGYEATGQLKELERR